jgi:DNA-directed RNA polymerase specialized sigma24 family protein
MSEIAQALDCPLQTAYSRLHKARARILALVERIAAESDHE